MARSGKKKFVMVGRKTLVAPIVKEEPIHEGDEVEVEGKALEYCKSKTYEDAAGNVHPMFVSPTSAEAKQVKAKLEDQLASTAGRRRRRRSA